MGYSTLNAVKERLGIDPADTTQDTVLTNKIAAADAIIDNVLQAYTDVPLASPPQLIQDISADLAAALYREDRGPPEAGGAFRQRAEKALEAYITQTYRQVGFEKT
ncbi:phage protein Gp36 family protein [Candidatus Hecatella orcuttiae]|jgi:hypothetical protein|uniref:phage protein Gp36 family protein n=1 Tax=Candidatus Hecatella orcuttiae TaxID=1935119 RepID=UPI002867B654|nr:phage protein Gp36 family protein [Candidatus Hecatella orcuttiae]